MSLDHDILKVNKNANRDEIKKAFKKRIFEVHPDRNQESKEWAENETKKVISAYERLSKKSKRDIASIFEESNLHFDESFMRDFFYSGFGRVVMSYVQEQKVNVQKSKYWLAYNFGSGYVIRSFRTSRDVDLFYKDIFSVI